MEEIILTDLWFQRKKKQVKKERSLTNKFARNICTKDASGIKKKFHLNFSIMCTFDDNVAPRIRIFAF